MKLELRASLDYSNLKRKNKNYRKTGVKTNVADGRRPFPYSFSLRESDWLQSWKKPQQHSPLSYQFAQDRSSN